MKKVKKNKIVIIVTSIAALVILAYCVIYPLMVIWIPGFGDMIDKLTYPERYKPIEYSIQGEYNDKFTLNEELVTTFPDSSYNYYIYVGSEKVLTLDNVRKIDNIKSLYNSSDLKCYMIFNYILYERTNDKSFKTVSIYDLLEYNDSYNFLIPCLREMLINDWDSIDILVDFLIKSNDTGSINIIRRYANGNITDEEIEMNKGSRYSKEEIIEICKNKSN